MTTLPRRSNGRVAARVKTLERSQIRVMLDMAEERGGEDLVHLEIGEPDFDTPQHVIDAATDALNDGATHYTNSTGIPELRRAIAAKMARENGIEADPDAQIVTTVGAVGALQSSIHAIAEPGDDVLLPTPSWPYYEIHATMAHANPVEVPLPRDRGFELDAESVVAAMTDDTAAVLLNTPNNPTGRHYDREAVRTVVDAAADHGTFVIADEVYEGILFEDRPESIASYVDHPECVLTINSCSKKYAMTGWRLGWVAGPDDVIEAVKKVHESANSCPAAVSQHAALAALDGPQDTIDEIREAFRERRDYVVDRIAEMPDVSCPRPDGGFYVFLDCSRLPGSSFEVAQRLFEEYEVVTVPGDAFGDSGEGYIRMSFANGLDRLEEGLDRVERMVRES
jgi:aspartate aminotransferase